MLTVPIGQVLRREIPAGIVDEPGIVDEHRAAIFIVVEATDVRASGSVRRSACRQTSGNDQQPQNGECSCHEQHPTLTLVWHPCGWIGEYKTVGGRP
jgi:hypothetical protein